MAHRPCARGTGLKDLGLALATLHQARSSRRRASTDLTPYPGGVFSSSPSTQCAGAPAERRRSSCWLATGRADVPHAASRSANDSPAGCITTAQPVERRAPRAVARDHQEQEAVHDRELALGWTTGKNAESNAPFHGTGCTASRHLSRRDERGDPRREPERDQRANRELDHRTEPHLAIDRDLVATQHADQFWPPGIMNSGPATMRSAA